ncbi:MAG: UvrD-helicase domain-containing protein [Saprospiraceae bacterium]|nr:UvrD-helicase domain-containing protein [Saprospiraceae bacterium]
MKPKFNQVFLDAYDQLNPAQKQAVDHIDGPVMVVAGPGTGKTQILALRICNILLKTDTRPQNILCLTYTDAGAIAMRKRLLQFVGTDAYKIQVHTYHSFCNQVIQDNQEIFSDYATLMHISDLEKLRCIETSLIVFPLTIRYVNCEGYTILKPNDLINFFQRLRKSFGHQS